MVIVFVFAVVSVDAFVVFLGVNSVVVSLLLPLCSLVAAIDAIVSFVFCFSFGRLSQLAECRLLSRTSC